jgi:hypothetical protein
MSENQTASHGLYGITAERYLIMAQAPSLFQSHGHVFYTSEDFMTSVLSSSLPSLSPPFTSSISTVTPPTSAPTLASAACPNADSDIAPGWVGRVPLTVLTGSEIPSSLWASMKYGAGFEETMLLACVVAVVDAAEGLWEVQFPDDDEDNIILNRDTIHKYFAPNSTVTSSSSSSSSSSSATAAAASSSSAAAAATAPSSPSPSPSLSTPPSASLTALSSASSSVSSFAQLPMRRSSRQLPSNSGIQVNSDGAYTANGTDIFTLQWTHVAFVLRLCRIDHVGTRDW